MSLSLPDIITCCSEAILMTKLKSVRRHMALTGRVSPIKLAITQGFQSACISFEKKNLLDAIEMNEGSRAKATKQLRLPIRTFYNKLKKFGLEGIDDEKMA